MAVTCMCTFESVVLQNVGAGMCRRKCSDWTTYFDTGQGKEKIVYAYPIYSTTKW
jgi:hypothetical protein